MAKKKFKDKMKILFVTTELTPLAKAGGLGDIAGYLPKALFAKFPIDIRIVMAKYNTIDIQKYPAKIMIKNIKIKMPDNKSYKKITVWKTFLPDTEIPVYLIDFRNFLSNEDGFSLRHIGSHYKEIPNYLIIFISKVTLEIIKIMDWYPDVIHYHDGFEGLISKWLKLIYTNEYKKIATVCTIHNLETQPKMKITLASKFGLKKRDFKKMAHFLRKNEINLTAEAIDNADMINTVSPSYAREVLTKKFGFGLHKLLKSKKAQFTGIINGIDYQNFDPRTNDDTPVKYGRTSLDLKVKNKLYLQKKFNLNQSAELPLICVVSRLVGQKGLDLIRDVLKDLVDMGAQFIILGGGWESLEKIFCL